MSFIVNLYYTLHTPKVEAFNGCILRKRALCFVYLLLEHSKTLYAYVYCYITKLLTFFNGHVITYYKNIHTIYVYVYETKFVIKETLESKRLSVHYITHILS